MNRLDLSSGRVSKIEEGSDARHQHPEPLSVELDPEGLALAIVAASRATREERRQERPHITVSHSEPVSDPDRILDLPAVDVWTEPDGAS